MQNVEKVRAVFSETLKLPIEQVVDDLAFNSIKEWDSVAHMALIAALEEAFDIMFEMDDVLAMSSFAKAVEILEKYGVE
jgi:acyl carrier protein